MLTHTIPGPPPGAGVVLATASDFAVAAAAAGLGELFGLNKSAKVFFGEAAGLAAGEAAVAGVAIATFFLALFDAGSVSVWPVAAGDALAAAEGAGVGDDFFRDFFVGEAEAAAAGLVAGDVSLAAFSFFFFVFFAGEAELSAAGDSLAAGVGD